MTKIFLMISILFFSATAVVATSCFRRELEKTDPVENAASLKVVLKDKITPAKDLELQRLTHYLEQADAVHREAWWVVANDRKIAGRSIFGKAQRALLAELNVKLSNKSMFSCDHYLVKREIHSPLGLPQSGEIFEKCSVKNEANRIAEYELKTKTEADISFFPQHLADVVGLATSIMNRKIHCHFKGDEDGKLDQMKCENMAQDRSAVQSIQFSIYDYEKSGQNLITLKGQVFESLSPVRKIEAQVPMSGKIEVTETQTEAPEVIAPKSLPAALQNDPNSSKTIENLSPQIVPPAENGEVPEPNSQEVIPQIPPVTLPSAR